MVIAAGLVLAVGAPATWWLTRRDPVASSAGQPVLVAPVATASPDRTPTSTPLPSAPATRSAAAGSGDSSGDDSDPLAAQPASPRLLQVPALGVDAKVQPVGVTDEGDMAIPEDVGRVGWYRFGPGPGATSGSAVLAGHVDSAKQGRGALYELGEVEVGARITVGLSDGTRIDYRVTGRQEIVKSRLPTEQLFVRDGPPRLVIVTCGGPFIRDLHSYRDNLIVLAVPESGT